MVKTLPVMQEGQEIQLQSLGWEDPLERAWQPTPVFLPGEVHGQRSLVGYSPRGLKESDTTQQLSLSLSFLSFLWNQWHIDFFLDQNVFS